ncbi:MAG: acetolactate decarboxylase [Lentisphaeria bacterium]|nr:acetolactate decarboxylase [Lentisphaeria bacterium]
MSRKNRQFTQISLFSVLLGGHYGGIVSVGEVKRFGNLAIATMDRLDGEMQMIDGVVYQACADGEVYLPGDDETVPFGTIADFCAEDAVRLAGIPSYEEFESRMNDCCPRNDVPLAIRLTGQFDCMKVRTVRRQEKDGVGLAEAAKDEAVFEFRDVRGDLVGFRLPGYVAGINAPGWHLHFMDESRKHGGHVVNFALLEGDLSFCHAGDYHIRLPDSPDVFAGLDLNRDWSGDLKKAEAER